MSNVQEAIDQGLELFFTFVRDDPALAEEFEVSVTDYFGGTSPVGEARETLMAVRRHLEWFLLERHSPSLFGAPVERLLDEWTRAASPDLVDHKEALLESFTGVFEVTQARAGEGAWLRDLAGLGDYPISDPEGAEFMEEGDLIVGRLFPIGHGLHHVSRAAGFFRNLGLRDALERDLGEARQRGAGNVLRLSQHELEAMFWKTAQQGQSGQPRKDVHDLLLEGGLSPSAVNALMQRLAASPWDPKRLLLGAQDTLSEILDELAFETEVDLERARKLMLEAWPTLSGADDDGAAEESKTDVSAAVREFEQGRVQGADLEALFGKLERELGLDVRSEHGSEDDTPAPDFPGVVGAMVEEFLWEVGLTQDEQQAERFASLRELGRFGERIGLFEELDATQLVRFAAFWIHERGSLGGAAGGQALLEALSAFCVWADEAHGLNLREQFGPTLTRLEDSLPRIAEANAKLVALTTVPDESTESGELLEVASLEAPAPPGSPPGSFAGERALARAALRDRAGRERTASIALELARHLREGDRLRGRVAEDGRALVYRCYPPEAAALILE